MSTLSAMYDVAFVHEDGSITEDTSLSGYSLLAYVFDPDPGIVAVRVATRAPVEQPEPIEHNWESEAAEARAPVMHPE